VLFEAPETRFIGCFGVVGGGGGWRWWTVELTNSLEFSRILSVYRGAPSTLFEARGKARYKGIKIILSVRIIFKCITICSHI